MCAELHSAKPARPAQRGMSIVELMVGMVVALLVGIAAAGSAQMFNASQRQAMSSGAASLNITSTLSGIKNDLSAAGLGFFGSSKYLCNKLNLSNGNTIVRNGTDFKPINLIRGTKFDTVEVTYASDVAAGANVMLRADSSGASAMVRSLLPVDVTNGRTPAVMLASSTDPNMPCTVRSVTASIPASTLTGMPQTLTFGPEGKHNQANFVTAPNFSERDYIAVLGELNWNRYRVEDDGRLVVERILVGDSAVLATNVVAFRAEYGMANDLASPRLDSWVSPANAGVLNDATLKKIRAIRLGVVTRSRQPEKPDADGNCTATLEMPKLFPEDANTVTPDLSGNQWKCYRYRAAQVVVPLRNVVW